MSDKNWVKLLAKELIPHYDISVHEFGHFTQCLFFCFMAKIRSVLFFLTNNTFYCN